MTQDPYQHRPSGTHENPFDGGAHSAQAPYQPDQYLQSYQQLYSSAGAQPGFYQPSYERIEGERAAQLSLVFGLVGFFIAGMVFGPLAIWQATKAERLGVPATAGKILGWIITVLYGLAILAVILFVVIVVAGLGAAASYGG